MEKNEKIFTVSAIANVCTEGFTINAKTFLPETAGYCVAVEETQNSFGPDGLARVIDYAEAHKDINAIGGWLDSVTGLYYYDAVIIVDDLQTAIELGRENGQLAVFDLANLEEIRL